MLRPLPEWCKLAIPMILTAVCLIVSSSIIISGYIVPSALNDGYILTTCRCGPTSIQYHRLKGYVGDVDLTYKSPGLTFTFTTYVLTADSSFIVQTYLNANYILNSTVICYVDTANQIILVTMFNTYVALGFCIVFVLFSAMFFIISVVCCCRAHRRRRSEYIDLDKISDEALRI